MPLISSNKSAPALSLYQLLDPEVLANPYPLYRRLREESPVYRHTDQVVVTSFDDVTRVLLDSSTFLNGHAGLRGSRVRANLDKIGHRLGLPVTVQCRTGVAISRVPPESAAILLQEADQDMNKQKA